MFEPWNSLAIGWLEILLALLVFSRAIPGAIAINEDASADIAATARLIDRVAASPLRFLPALLAILRLLGSVIANRIMVLKLWALGVALGCFGIGRAFGPSYSGADAWIYSLGHYCLISYTALRLAHIARVAGKAKWWKELD